MGVLPEMKRLTIGFIFMFLLFLSPAYAHVLQQVSYNQVQVDKNNLQFLNLQDGNSYFILATDETLRPQIRETLKVYNNGQPCELTTFINNLTDPYFFVAECGEEINNLHIYDLFLQNDTVDKVYFVNYGNQTTTFAGTGKLEFNVTITGSLSSSGGESKLSLFIRYLKLGLEHILSGLDHIFFILGYILLAATFAGLLKGITGFTTSHSATLTLAALGILVVPATIVEPLIALSIVVVAVLALVKKAQSWLIRFGIIFLFGLFHGLGFAGSIAEVGFPKEGFLAALLGFSVGIELGQLLIVMVVFPLLWYGDTRFPVITGKIRWGLAGIIIAMGTFWLIQRLFF